MESFALKTWKDIKPNDPKWHFIVASSGWAVVSGIYFEKIDLIAPRTTTGYIASGKDNKLLVIKNLRLRFHPAAYRISFLNALTKELNDHPGLDDAIAKELKTNIWWNDGINKNFGDITLKTSLDWGTFIRKILCPCLDALRAKPEHLIEWIEEFYTDCLRNIPHQSDDAHWIRFLHRYCDSIALRPSSR